MSKSEVIGDSCPSPYLAKLRHLIDLIEHSIWLRTGTQWGERAEYVDDDDRRDEVLRDLKSIYHQLGGPKL